MVGPGNPEGAVAAHAVPAEEDVDLRLLEHVAHVKAACDIRRRQQQREGGLCAVAFGWSGDVEQLFVHPIPGPLIFKLGGVVGF